MPVGTSAGKHSHKLQITEEHIHFFIKSRYLKKNVALGLFIISFGVVIVLTQINTKK